MSAQSLLARLGLRTAALGSLASLTIAAPLADGDVSQAAHTDASRIGVYFDRASGNEGIYLVTLGVRRLAVTASGPSASRSTVLGQDHNELFGYGSGLLVSGGTDNTCFGAGCMTSTVAGGYNTAVGSSALHLATGFGNVAIGYSAAYNSIAGAVASAGSLTTNRSYVIVSLGSTDFTLIGAASNTVGLHFVATGAGAGSGTAAFTSGACVAIGYRALASATSSYGIAIGPNALSSITANSGIAIGRDALRACTADGNIGIGASSMRSLATGTSNTALGGGTLFSIVAGRWNVAIGEASVLGSMAGAEFDSSYNIGIGWGAAGGATIANGNIIIGIQAGNVPASLYGNLFLGAGAGNNLGASVSNTLAIGGNVAGIADSRINTVVIDYNASSNPKGPLVLNKMDFNEVVSFEQSIVQEAAQSQYWGDPNTDGSWRVGRSGNNLVFSRREAGSWVIKQTITP